MSKREKKNLRRIIIASSCFIIVYLIDFILKQVFKSRFSDGIASIIQNDNLYWILPFLIHLIIYIYIGYDVIKKCFKNIKRKQFFDENFLMVFATTIAFILGIYKGINKMTIEGFDEACAVIIFYQVGEWFEKFAIQNSRKSITDLLNIRPDSCNLMIDGSIKIVDPKIVNIGDVIVVNPGEKVPLDGIIIKGESLFDTKALTGESLPKHFSENDLIISGIINIDSSIYVKVTKSFYDSTVKKILDLVENESFKKAKTENFITKFAKFYTPLVVILAILLAIILSVITKEYAKWIYRALSFLVVSCPCALVISIPLSFFSGIGKASKNGIMIKGSSFIERFSKTKVFVFDKTGTITKGTFKVTKVYPENKKEEILRLASIAERKSSHPIALSIIKSYKELYNNPLDETYEIKNVLGKGVISKNSTDEIIVGKDELLIDNNISFEKIDSYGTVVNVAFNKTYVGSIVIEDEIKEEAIDVISKLNNKGCQTIMLTGDNSEVARKIANKLQVSSFKSNLLPQDKVNALDEIMSKTKKEELVCFVGDGINDAPVIMKSDIGIAMGGVGSDAAIEASDIVLMNDNLDGIIKAKKISKLTMNVVYENIIFSLAIKVLVLVLSAIGILNMWGAVFGDVGVAFIAILNAVRINKK